VKNDSILVFAKSTIDSLPAILLIQGDIETSRKEKPKGKLGEDAAGIKKRQETKDKKKSRRHKCDSWVINVLIENVSAH